MRLHLTLATDNVQPVIPLNYQYPLSSAIYRVLQQGNAPYADFLHNDGYGINGKRFKLFTFSDLRVPFRVAGDRMLLTGREASLIICFQLPDAAEHFIRGLFMNQQLDIADCFSKTGFTVQQAELLPLWNNTTASNDTVICLHPLSPIVAGIKNERGHYDYLSPQHPGFAESILYNWKEKYTVLYGEDAAAEQFNKVQVKVLQAEHAKSRLITIKAHTAEATRIRGFIHFNLQVQAPEQVLELALNAGLGLYNSQGMGCVGVV